MAFSISVDRQILWITARTTYNGAQLYLRLDTILYYSIIFNCPRALRCMNEFCLGISRVKSHSR